MHRSAARHRVWDSSTACRWAYLPVPPDLPTKTPYLGHIPLCEIDGRTCLRVEIGKTSIRPEGLDSALTNQPPPAFHETGRVPAISD